MTGRFVIMDLHFKCGLKFKVFCHFEFEIKYIRQFCFCLKSGFFDLVIMTGFFGNLGFGRSDPLPLINVPVPKARLTLSTLLEIS